MQDRQKYHIQNRRLTGELCGEVVLALDCMFLAFVPWLVVARVIISKRDLLKSIDWWLKIMAFGIGTIMTVIFLLCFVFFVKRLVVRSRLFHTSIVVADEGIRIVRKDTEYSIRRSQILHILGGITYVTLIWKFQDRIVTFNISERLFGTKTIKELREFLRAFEQYTDDSRQIMLIRKNLNLDDMLRNKSFEYQLTKF